MFRIFLCAGLMMACLTGFAGADSPPPFKDFSAKRVKPPQPGTRQRITVQIAPDAPVVDTSSGATEGDGGAPVAKQARYDAFWEDVPFDLASAGAGRLFTALRSLSRSDVSVAAPRLADMQAAIQNHGTDILKATIGTDVSPALVLAVMMVESAGRTDAVSSAGATGLMQLMPATAARFDVADSFQASDNIEGGVRYLDWLMQTFDRDPILVLAGYNAGEGAVKAHSGVPPFAETRDYVPKVLAAYQVARALCQTPPELASDGCVFTRIR